MDGSVWYFSSLTAQGKRLGYKQMGENGFNMSFVIDGTKDSCKLVVQSFDSVEIKPYTIIYDEDTATWWIVSHDKVSRYQNETINKFYIHELELVGLFELLNARDLTDCGFNNDRYTFDSFIKRLFKLTDCESKIKQVNIVYNDLIEPNQRVDYLKTFENYTLASALREFLDGYNLVGKLTFTLGNNHYISGNVNLVLYSKSGKQTESYWNDSEFNDIRETKTIDKNSYGTTVVSNADNVISTQVKRFPLVSGVKVSANEFTITPQNAIIRLPSKVHEVKKVSMYDDRTRLSYYLAANLQITADYDPTNDKSIDSAFTTIYNEILTLANGGTERAAEFLAQENTIKQKMREYPMVVFQNGVGYDPITNTYSSDFTRNTFKKYNGYLKEYNLGPKTLRNAVADTNEIMYWERGTDFIGGFDFFLWWACVSTSPQVAMIECTNKTTERIFYSDSGTESAASQVYIGEPGEGDGLRFMLKDTRFVVEYVPMSDLKIKLDNESEGKDIKLYNQNGKLTDSNALSKLMLSYSKEITSNTITKYTTFYLGNSETLASATIPHEGDIVNIGSEFYVINNVSFQFYPTEYDNSGSMGMEYFIEAQYTMSKQTGTKSMLTNPNTNIRDYGIPQKNNVKRKQLYRDFYEFSSTEQGDTNWYQPITNLLNVGSTPIEYQDHKAIIKTSFTEIGNLWYYQLDTSVFRLKKSIYEVVDFGDNNIIGYDMQTIYSGFDITRVFGNVYDDINTPVSYVDNLGEVADIQMAFCNKQQYSTILNEISATDGYKLAYHVFVNSTLYTKASQNCDFKIDEIAYNKDALEIPVFEYCAQIDDSDEVIVGENIFPPSKKKIYLAGDVAEFDAKGYLYSYVLVPKNTATQQNAMRFAPEPQPLLPNSFRTPVASENSYLKGGATLTTTTSRLSIQFWEECEIDASTGETTKTYMNQSLWDGWLFEEYDILIFRHNIFGRIWETTDLMFIIRNVENFEYNVSQNQYGYLQTLYLDVNHYKL